MRRAEEAPASRFLREGPCRGRTSNTCMLFETISCSVPGKSSHGQFRSDALLSAWAHYDSSKPKICSCCRFWMGYVAVGAPDKSTGLREVVFAWRGTIARSEWRVDLASHPVEHEEGSEAMVAEGFSTMYMVATEKPDFGTPKVRTAFEMKQLRYPEAS